MTHCWQGKGDWIAETFGENSPEYDAFVDERWSEGGCDSTCLLEKGHDGPHEFTPDNQIRVSFSESQ